MSAPGVDNLNGADQRGRYFATSQYTSEGTALGNTRGFTRLWDTDALGVSKGTQMETGWARGDLVRSGQPAFVLTQLGPAYDVTKNPASWRPAL